MNFSFDICLRIEDKDNFLASLLYLHKLITQGKGHKKVHIFAHKPDFGKRIYGMRQLDID